ncbi:response regulator [Dokdonia sp. Hel_I_53]|uniref:tetratricopeptide repeat-containing hybrid sensor histidine kinase/response regulator n=1 Tax=Dokdonia sp. Hel_I_53 TaxID=1566287 RepID=UPI00119C8931|nr:response regulator [Dokdonia sp. Hel_I_53]TVZ53068.1 phospho-acceptor domain-containing protein [Dokdonia sp. Hel_I_53]
MGFPLFYIFPQFKITPLLRNLTLSAVFFLFSLTILSQDSTSIDRDYINKLTDSATTFYNTGNHSKSLELTIKIIKAAEKINDTGNLLNGYRYLGYDYLMLNDTIRARDSFEKAQSLANLINDTQTLGLSYMDLANLYGSSKDQLKKALIYHKKSIETFKASNDSLNLGTAYYNTAYTLFDHDKPDIAAIYLYEADKYKYALDINLRAGIQNSWAEYYLEKKDYEKVDYYLSEVFLDTALHKSKLDLADSYDLYSKSLYAQKRYKEAYEAGDKYQSLFEKNIDQLQTEKSQKVAAQYEVAQYKKDIERTELQNELQANNVRNKDRVNQILLVVVIFFFLLIAILLYAFFTRKKYVRNLRIKNIAYLKAKQKSEELSRSKTEFFSTVSHELRTPLYGVIGLSTILLDDPALKSHEEDIKSLKFSADYLLALINDVLQINKVDSKSLKEEFVVFNVRELIQTITSSFEYMRLQNNNVIITSIKEDVPTYIKGDTIRLSQILMNLIGNACKFTENGTITVLIKAVSVSKNKCRLHFSIQDNGVGIPQERKERIFDEFSQIGSKHYSYQGTGLGLPIVKKLLALHNSEIKLESKYGEGSNFYFELDFSIAQINERPEANAPLGTSTSLQNKEILIVDDNRINQKVTQKILEKSNVICTIAGNGKDAVEKAKHSHFDLILMDVNMPIMNGMEATEKIREFNQNVPIIALTAVEIKEMRDQIYASGMNDIIVKPYDIHKFRHTIANNLHRLVV